MMCFEESFFEDDDVTDDIATAESVMVARKLGDSMATASPSKYGSSKNGYVSFK